MPNPKNDTTDSFSGVDGMTGGVLSVMGMVVVWIGALITEQWDVNMGMCVLWMCPVFAAPFALQAFYAAVGNIPIRLAKAFILWVLTANTIFQVSRGTATTHDQLNPSIEVVQPVAGAVIPGFKITTGLFAAMGAPAFRPYDAKFINGVWTVLVYDDVNGKRVTRRLESVQAKGGEEVLGGHYDEGYTRRSRVTEIMAGAVSEDHDMLQMQRDGKGRLRRA